MPTHYEVLGVSPEATQDEVRRAYRRLVKAAHPDVAGDTSRFRQITQAYDVLSDPAQRALYDRRLRPAPAPLAVPPDVRRPRRYGRFVVLLVVALVAGGVAWLAVATARRSVGDDCLVGTWQGMHFEIPFRGSLDGRDVSAPIRGGAGVVLRVGEDGTVRSDYTDSAPFAGAQGATSIEGRYLGTTIERWHARNGRVEQTDADTSQLRFLATINGRPPDRPLAVSVVDRAYPYLCSATALEVGPYRYTRAFRQPVAGR